MVVSLDCISRQAWPTKVVLIIISVPDFMKSQQNVSIITVGDHLCQLLEVGWENEKRVVTKSGKWSVRETLAFLDVCDLVIGPETGVLNAASTLECHKTVLLSHSSHENLSKHWKNTPALPRMAMYGKEFGYTT